MLTIYSIINCTNHGRGEQFLKYLLLFYLFANFTQSQSILVVTEDAPPLQIYKNGELTGGIAVELVQAIFKQTKLTSDIQVYPWVRAYQMALTQKDTLIFSIAKSLERKDDFIWIAKLYSLQPNITKLKSSTDIKITSPQNISSYQIAVSRGDYGESYLKSIGLREGKNLHLTIKHRNLWKLLYSNRVDAIFTNQVSAKSEIKEAGLDVKKAVIVYKIEGIASEVYLAANKHTDISIINKLQLAFQEIKNNGTYQKIREKWQQKIQL